MKRGLLLALLMIGALFLKPVPGQANNPSSRSVGCGVDNPNTQAAGCGLPKPPVLPIVDTNSYVQFPTAATSTNRNDFTGSLGFSFALSAPITVDKLGRLYIAGNTRNHAAYIWDSAATGTPVATCTILAASASDANNFKYCTLGRPVALIASHNYAITLDELSGGDSWLDSWSSCCSLNFMQAVFGSTSATFSGTRGTAPGSFIPGSNTVFTAPSIVYH